MADTSVQLKPTTGIWKFYGGLFLEIPHAFRSALEAWVFWIGGGASLIVTILGFFGVTVDPLPEWVAPAGVGLAFVYGMLRANYHRYRALEATTDRVQAELLGLKQPGRKIIVRIHDISPIWQIHSAGPFVLPWPGLTHPFVIMMAQVTISNPDKPTTLSRFNMTLKLSDGRVTCAWFLREPQQTLFLANITQGYEVPQGKDIREITAANAFGNGDTRTGWLLGIFPGIAPTDTAQVAGQEFTVMCHDIDGELFGRFFNVQYKKDRPMADPGLTAETP